MVVYEWNVNLKGGGPPLQTPESRKLITMSQYLICGHIQCLEIKYHTIGT